MTTPPDTCELPDKDVDPCGMTALAQCNGCGRHYCWGHVGTDRDYLCAPCYRAGGGG